MDTACPYIKSYKLLKQLTFRLVNQLCLLHSQKPVIQQLCSHLKGLKTADCETSCITLLITTIETCGKEQKLTVHALISQAKALFPFESYKNS